MKALTVFLILFWPRTGLQAQSGLAPPQVGFAVDSQHALRPVLGFAGNLILGKPILANVASSAWSNTNGVIKTGSALLLLNRQGQILRHVDTANGPALLAFRSTGDAGLAFLPQSGVLFGWNAEGFKPLSLRLDALAGTPISIDAANWDCPVFIVQRADGLWLVEISNRTGALESQTALPGVQAPALLQAGGSLLYSNGTALVLRNPAGNEQQFQLALTIAEIRLLGNDWVHVLDQTGAHQFLVRLTPGHQTTSQLPEMQ